MDDGFGGALELKLGTVNIGLLPLAPREEDKVEEGKRDEKMVGGVSLGAELESPLALSLPLSVGGVIYIIHVHTHE